MNNIIIEEPKKDEDVDSASRMQFNFKTPTVIPMKNKGTGAGGANTNLNGLAQEERVMKKFKDELGDKYKCLSKGEFLKFMKPHHSGDKVRAHGARSPDMVWVNDINKKMVIVEIKYQIVTGSVCEKLSGAIVKRESWQNQYPEWKIEYCFVMNSFLFENCEFEINFNRKWNIPSFLDDEVGVSLAAIYIKEKLNDEEKKEELLSVWKEDTTYPIY